MTALDRRTEEIPVTVAAAELATGLTAVLPHVGLRRQQTGPELTCIQLTVEPGQVTLAGTDRYTLGVCTIPADNQAAAENFLLKRQDAKAILGLIGRPGPGHPAVSATTGTSWPSTPRRAACAAAARPAAIPTGAACSRAHPPISTRVRTASSSGSTPSTWAGSPRPASIGATP